MPVLGTRPIATVALAATLLAGAPGARADFDSGLAAYRDGDYATALVEFRKLADRGVVIAYTNLGYMYALGEGVEADLAEAARWFERAARAGDVASQLTLGVMYANGEGVERDQVKAFAWLSLAGAAGRDVALDYLELVRERLDSEGRDRANRLARALFRDHGDPDTQRLAAEGWGGGRGAQAK